MRALTVLAVVVAMCAVGWLGWSTVIAFAGGDVPLTPFHLHGRNALRGVAWLLTADPIALGVVATAISVPFAARSERAVPAAANGRLALGRQLVRTATLTAHVSSGLRIMVVAAFTVAIGVVGFGWLLWTAAVAFVGGIVPLTGWHLAGMNVARGLLVLCLGVPLGFLVLVFGYTIAVTAAASPQLRVGLDAAEHDGRDVRTGRTWVRVISGLAFAVALGAALAWSYTT